MLIRDIHPPIRQAASMAVKKVSRTYQVVKLFIKTTRFGIPIFVLIGLLITGGVVYATSGKDKTATYLATRVSSNDWENPKGALGIDATSSEGGLYDTENSAYLYVPISKVFIAPETSETEIPTSTENPSTDTSTSSPETPAENHADAQTEPSREPSEESTEPPEELNSPSQISAPEEEIKTEPPIELPVELETPAPNTTTEEVSSEKSLSTPLSRLFSFIRIALAQDSNPDTSPPPPPPPPPTPEPQAPETSTPEETAPPAPEETAEDAPAEPSAPKETEAEAETSPVSPVEEASPEIPPMPQEDSDNSVILPNIDGNPPSAEESGDSEILDSSSDSAGSETILESSSSSGGGGSSSDSPTSSSTDDTNSDTSNFPAPDNSPEENISIFTTQKSLFFSDFASHEKIDRNNSIKELKLELYFQMDGRQGEDDILLVEYRQTPKDSWNQAASILQDINYSHTVGNPFVVQIPTEASASVALLETLEVRVSNLSNNAEEKRLPVAIDGLSLKVEYEETIREKEFLELASDKQAFRADETPSLSFKYKNPQGLSGFIKKNLLREKSIPTLKAVSINSSKDHKILQKFNLGNEEAGSIQKRILNAEKSNSPPQKSSDSLINLPEVKAANDTSTILETSESSSSQGSTAVPPTNGETISMDSITDVPFANYQTNTNILPKLEVKENDWNLEIQAQNSELKPGRYIAEFEIEEDGTTYRQEVEFYWGVLVVNTRKSIYTPGETAEMHMAALESDGNTICDANLNLIVSTPSGEKLHPQVKTHKSCKPNNITDSPDYSASQLLEEIGIYEMRLERLDENGDVLFFITDTFEVRDSVPFVVKRDSATRIYPLADYTMNLLITAKEDYKGPVRETLPASFRIASSTKSYKENALGERRSLEWQVDLKEGETARISYTYDAPNISPEIFLLGKLEIGEFKEARYWQLASDATTDIKIQRGETAIGNSGGTDTTFDPVSATSSAFELNSNNQKNTAGRDDENAGNLEIDDISGTIELTDTSTLTFTRESGSISSDMRFNWEIWEYTGEPGGANEFIVRSRNTVTLSGTSNATQTLDTSPTNDDKIIPFITGISSNQTTNGEDLATAIAYIDDNGFLNVTRGGTTGTTIVQVVSVEFTGSNWSVGHGIATGQTGDTGSITLNTDSDGAGGSTFSVDSWSEASIFGLTVETSSAEGLAHQAVIYEPNSATDTVDWTFHSDHAATNDHMVHVLHHSDMVVSRFTSTDSSAGDVAIDISSAGLTDLEAASIEGSSVTTSGTGDAMARGWRNFELTSTSNVVGWAHRSGNTMEYEVQVTDLSGVTTQVQIQTHEELRVTGYTWELDDSTDQDPDGNSILAGSDFSTGPNQLTGTSSVEKGERVTLRVQVDNIGNKALDSDLALFYDGSDGFWTKVQDSGSPQTGPSSGGSCQGFNGAGGSSNWSCETVFDGSSGNHGTDVTIAIDAFGKPWLAAKSNEELVVANYVGSSGTCPNYLDGGSAAWNCEVIFEGDSSNDLWGVTIGIGENNEKWVVFTNDEAAGDDIDVAQFVGSGGDCLGFDGAGGSSAWDCTQVHDGAEDSTSFEQPLDIAFDQDGDPWIVYIDDEGSSDNVVVAEYVGSSGSCATYNDNGGSAEWDCTVVYDGDHDEDGRDSHIAFDPAGNAWIVFADASSTDQIIAAENVGSGGDCDDTAQFDGGSDAWDCTIVFQGDSSGFEGRDVSFAFDPAGDPWVSIFNDEGSGNDAVVVAHYVGTAGQNCDGFDGTGGSDLWDCETIFEGDQPWTGEWSHIAFDVAGRANVAFSRSDSDGTDDLYIAKYVGAGGNCDSLGDTSGSDAWNCEQVMEGSVSTDSRNIELAFTPDGNAWIVAQNLSSEMIILNTDFKNEFTMSPALASHNGTTTANGTTTIAESHADMTSVGDTTGRGDADCISGGTWNDGEWFQSENGNSNTLSLPAGDSTVQCTELAWTIDTSHAQAGTTYRFTIATKDDFDPSSGIWRGLADATSSCGSSGTDDCFPTLSIVATSSNDIRYAKDNQARFEDCTDTNWGCTAIDLDGNIGTSIAIVTKPDGNPAIAYVDGSNSDLMYAEYVGTGGSGCGTGGSTAWNCEIAADLSLTISQIDLAIDMTGSPWISAIVASTNNELRAYNKTSGSWTAYSVETSTDNGYTSIAISPGGNPWISVQDTTSGSLKIVQYVGGSWGTGCDSSAWNCAEVDDTAVNTGRDSSIAFDASGTAWVSYYNVSNTSLEVAHFVGSGGSGCTLASWECEVVDNPSDNGSGSHIAISPDGTPYVASLESGGPFEVLHVAYKVGGGGGSGCDNADWTCAYPASGVLFNDHGAGPIQFDADGNAWVAFYNGVSSALAVAAENVNFPGSSSCSGNWYCSITVDNTANVGTLADITFDHSGAPWIAYRDLTSTSTRIAKLHNSPSSLYDISRTPNRMSSAGSGNARYRLDSGESPSGTSTCDAANSNNQGYCGVASDDSYYDGITALYDSASSTQYPLFTFATESATTNASIATTWIGQSSVAPSGSTITLQVYKYSSSTWETPSYDTDTCSSASANSDCQITAVIATSTAIDYYDTVTSTEGDTEYWSYWRLYQATSSSDIGLLTNSFVTTSTAPAAAGSSTTTISGISNLADNTVVAFAIDGSLGNGTSTVSSGSWTITTTDTLSSSDIITVWADNVGDSSEAVGMTKYDGSGNITEMTLNSNIMTIGSADYATFTASDFVTAYDRSDDEDIMFSATTSAEVNIDPDGSYAGDQLVIATSTVTIATGETLNGHDLQIDGVLQTTTDGAYQFSGSWVNNATFTAASSTVTFTSGSTGETIAPGGDVFWDVVFNGSGGAWSFTTTTTIDSDLTMTAGTLDNSNGTSTITVNGGDVTGNGTITLTGETFTVNATGTFGGNTSWTFNNLNFGGGTAGTKTASGTGEITVSSVLTIASSNVLDASTKTWNLTGSDTPFVITGTFTASTSKFDYQGSSATNIASTTYYDLTLDPPSATAPTYTFYAGTTTVENDLLLSASGGGAVTADLNTNLVVLDVNGSITMGSGQTFSAPSSLLLAGDLSNNNGTFTNNNGSITFDGTATSTIDSGGSTFFNVNLAKTSAANVLLSTSPIDIDGDLTIGSSTTFDVSASACSSASCDITIAGNFTANATFTPQTGNVTFDGSSTSTITGPSGSGPVSVSRTGSVTYSTSTANNSTTSVSIPSDAEIMVVGVLGYKNVDASFYSNSVVTIGGNTMSADATTTSNTAVMGGIWYYVNPPTGDQDFEWDWNGSDTPDNGTIFLYSFYKNIDTGDPIGGSDVQQVASTAATITLVPTSGDAIVAVGGGGLVTAGDWTNATEIQEIDINNSGEDTVGSFAEAFTSGSTDVTFTTTDNITTAMGLTLNQGTGTATGTLSFYDFTSSTNNKVLEFATGTTYTIDGELGITGSSGNEIALQSTASGTQWFINHQGTESVSYADIHDGGCDASSTNITTSNSIDRGNNDSCWVFGDGLSFSIDAVSRSLSLTSADTFTATTSNTLTVTSTASLGYTITAYQVTDLTHQNTITTIPDWSATTGSTTIWTGNCIDNSECGWGFNSTDIEAGFPDANYYSAFTTSTAGYTVADATSSISGATTTITYKASVSNTQPAGAYSTTIRYILTPEF